MLRRSRRVPIVLLNHNKQQQDFFPLCGMLRSRRVIDSSYFSSNNNCFLFLAFLSCQAFARLLLADLELVLLWSRRVVAFRQVCVRSPPICLSWTRTTVAPSRNYPLLLCGLCYFLHPTQSSKLPPTCSLNYENKNTKLLASSPTLSYFF